MIDMQNVNVPDPLDRDSVLSRLPAIFTVDDVSRISGWTSQRAQSEVLNLAHHGWATRLRKGLYALHVAGRSHPLDVLEALELAKPSALAYWTALNYNHLTEQMPRVIVVQTPRFLTKRSAVVDSVSVRLVSIKPERFWGIVSLAVPDGIIHLTTPEKTVVDCLDRLDLCGGITEVKKAFGSGSSMLSCRKLADAANRFGSVAVSRRLLYLTSILGWHAKWMRSHLHVPPAGGEPWLDPTAPHDVIAHKMHLRINVTEEDITNAE